MYEAPIREPLILGDKNNHEITEDICRPIEGKANKYWWWCFIASVAALLWWVLCVSITVGEGIGM